MLTAAGRIFASIVRLPRKIRVRLIAGATSANLLSFSEPSSRTARTPRASAEMNSPQTLCRGKFLASKIATLAPKRAAVIAAEVPAGPPPMTAMSKCSSDIGIWHQQRAVDQRCPFAALRKLLSQTARPAPMAKAESLRLGTALPDHH